MENQFAAIVAGIKRRPIDVSETALHHKIGSKGLPESLYLHSQTTDQSVGRTVGSGHFRAAEHNGPGLGGSRNSDCLLHGLAGGVDSGPNRSTQSHPIYPDDRDASLSINRILGKSSVGNPHQANTGIRQQETLGQRVGAPVGQGGRTLTDKDGESHPGCYFKAVATVDESE